MYTLIPRVAAIVVAAMSLAPVAAGQPEVHAQPQPPVAQPQPQVVQPQLPTPQPQTPVTAPQPTATPQPPAHPDASREPAPPPVGASGTAGQLSAPCTPADVSTALPLLDRVARLLDGAIKDELGKVEMDRGTIAEMRAEIAQIRAAIQPVKP